MNRSGFTLVEILVALAIVGVSFAVLLKIVSGDLDRARQARDEAVATARLQSLLAAADATEPTFATGTYGDGATWKVEVVPEPTAKSDWPVAALAVSATVSWREDGTTRSRTLTALRVAPKAAAP